MSQDLAAVNVLDTSANQFAHEGTQNEVVFLGKCRAKKMVGRSDDKSTGAEQLQNCKIAHLDLAQLRNLTNVKQMLNEFLRSFRTFLVGETDDKVGGYISRARPPEAAH